jgi:hypothetical protein
MANGKNDEYPDDWFFSPENSAVEALDIIGVNTGAVDALNLIGEGTVPPAYQRSFGFDEQMGRGMDYVADAAEDVSQDVIDKVSPALHIVGFETARKLIQRDWKWPKGWSPKVRTAGKHFVAYNLALQASEMVYSHVDDWNKNHPDMKLKPLPSQLAAGAGAYVSYKTASKFAWTLANSVKSGMAAEAVETVFKEAGEKATRQALKQFGTSQSARVAARLFGQEAAEKAATEAAGEVVKRMGKTAVDEFDEIKRVLKNPKVATRVGKYLARFAPKIAAKLAASASAPFLSAAIGSIVPGAGTTVGYGLGTAISVAGITWTAIDIFNLMKDMPDASTLRNLLFEEIPERSAEDMLIDEMGASDSLFVPQEENAAIDD